MEQWEKDFRKKAEDILEDTSYKLPYNVRASKKQYIEHQVNKERRHRQLVSKI